MVQRRSEKREKNLTSSPSQTRAGSASSIPSISLPKGGGAIRGIDEKFSVNPVSGTASLSIPIFTTPGRSDFYPKLSVDYDSGGGNGPFGLGWNLSIPSIARKTDKGLPRYRDEEESDTYVLSGAEDLVPALIHDDQCNWGRDIIGPVQDKVHGKNIDDEAEYTVCRYRPRIEGLFARIERWQNKATGDVHWRSISKDNITNIYGKSPASRIADPEDDSRVFKWLLERSYDDKGNVIIYEYKQENQENIDRSLPQEKNRIANNKSYANKYLKRIKYANKTSYRVTAPQLPSDWLMEVVFDYGEHDLDSPEVNGPHSWPVRPDAFSSYRAGFEIRTQRLCHRVLMFHHFEELGNTPCLVRSTDFRYDGGSVTNYADYANAGNPIATYLVSVTQTGCVRKKAEAPYTKKSLPPLEFNYTEFQVSEKIEAIDAESLENLPIGLDGSQYQWVDLDGEGIAGILTEQADAWFYKRSLGNGRFGPLQCVATMPSLGSLRTGRAQVMDLAGDGQKDIVLLDEPLAGFYERKEENCWNSFVPFVSSPKINWRDPNLRVVDLTGDGHADVLITENDVNTWYLSKAEAGFEPSNSVRKELDEEKGPALVFADATQSIYLADMAGDGLSDIVRIKNGEVCYWPNLGYGRFGAKVTMDDAPYFDSPDQFDQQRIRLADIDGSGTTDIIYLGTNRTSIWRNQSGNSWSAPHHLTSFPLTDNLSSVTVVDLLGNGTACIVWSSPLPGEANEPMRYVDLMAEGKPHLLQSVVNNMGAETRLQYASSTKFYLEDLEASKPWISKLPFPVHVVERVETREMINDAKLVTLYKYHHGYFDGEDREFRGFGMVEQWDTESFDQFNEAGLFDTAPTRSDEGLHLPPVYTRTWFHTGVYRDREHISRLYKKEYYREDNQAVVLPDTMLPGENLTSQEEYEACRSLKGSILRQEIYALDDRLKSEHPYSVSERNYQLRRVQPVHTNRHAVFFAYPSETLDYHYERNPNDPRMSHQLTLNIDEYGNVTKAAAIGYGRRPAPAGQPEHPAEQTKTLMTCTENVFRNKSDESEWYRIGIPIETRTYELTGLPSPAEPDTIYTIAALLGSLEVAHEIPYEEEPNHEEPHKRLIEHVRTLYLRNDLSGPLPLDEIESLALPYESYKMAFTHGLLSMVYGDRVDESLLKDEGKYIKCTDYKTLNLFPTDDQDDIWWIPSGRSFFSPDPDNPDTGYARDHFYIPQGVIDPFGSVSHITFDDYDLLVNEIRDPLDNIIRADNDYRTMQPELVIDPNGNRSEVAFDALGMVVGTAVMGKDPELFNIQPEGDSLEGFISDLDDEIIKAHIDTPLASPHAILQDATTRLVYDFGRYYHDGRPNVVYTLSRETHVADENGERTKFQHSFLYFDGLGREAQSKIQAESGDVNEEYTEERWVGSGWTIYNNKGKPVKQYEPFFSATHAFENNAINGVSPILFYDPLERLMATLHPNHTYEKVVFDPWQQETWDVNDTVSQTNPKDDPDVGHYFDLLPETDYLPTWYERMISGTSEEQDAAEKAMTHAGTSAIAHLDTLGRTFLTIADNGLAEDGTEQKHETRVVLDIEGNQREITDPRLNTVMQYGYDMLSNQVYQNSMDAGKRWKFSNITGSVIKQWDERNHEVTLTYDELQRPREMHVTGGDGTAPLDKIYEKINYGDFAGMTGPQRDVAEQLNLIGKPKEHYDTAGRVIFALYDFKGNLKKSTRQLLNDYKNTPDWAGDDLEALVEQELFNTEIEYDALNRVIQTKTPDGSITIPAYNDAGLLEKIEITQDGETKPYVKNIDYNEKGQRILITYGNDVETSYEYHTETFRLIHMRTRRASNSLLQDLYYTYDPAGNITQIEDKNIPEQFFNNERIEGVSKYRYDPLYRLVEALGREHIGQVDFGDHDNWHDLPFSKKYSPGDDMAWRNYTQSYKYDKTGNITQMKHLANGGSWTRNYEYSDDNNRLIKTIVGVNNNNNFNYNHYPHHPQHGFMTGMPHLQVMEWNFKEELKVVAEQRREDGGTPQTTYYVYDSDGQRVRKVTENSAEPSDTPAKKCERIYVDGIEVYREYTGIHVGLERKTLHIMDDTRRIAMIETRNDVTDGSPKKIIRYQISNHLGSACMETDDSVDAHVISYEEYHPYGTTAYRAMNEDIQVAAKRYRYTGKERDDETGLYYHGARYYTPWLARWTSCDPNQGLKNPNLYRYAKGSPIMFTDPSGTTDEAVSSKAEHLFHTAHIVELSELLASQTEAVGIIQEYNALELELSKSHQAFRSALMNASGGKAVISRKVLTKYQKLLEKYGPLAKKAEKASKLLQKHHSKIAQLSMPVVQKTTQHLKNMMTKVVTRASYVLESSKLGRGVISKLAKGKQWLGKLGKVAIPVAILSSAILGWEGMPPESTTVAKTTNAALSGGWAAFQIAHPSLIIGDIFLPEPVEPSRIFRGTSTAATVLTEGISTGEEAPLVSFHEASKGGHAPWHIQFGSWMYEYLKEKGGLGTLLPELNSLLETHSKNWEKKTSEQYLKTPEWISTTLTFYR